MKRKLSLILSSLLLVSSIASCTPKEQASQTTKPSDDKTTSGETKPADSSKTSNVSVMIFDRGNAPQGEGTVDNNRWTKYLNEEMGKQNISLKFVPVPRSEEHQKIPVMMASQTAPDVTLTYNFDNISKWYKEGGIQDVTQSFENYGADLKSYLGEEVLKNGLDENGVRFAIPARRATTANQNAFIRKDWLDKLGLPIPTSQDELYTALKAFKEKDPGGIGKENVIAAGGMGGNTILAMSYIDIKAPIDYTINSLALTDVNYFAAFAYKDKAFEGFLKFNNRLYNEGLIDPEYFTSKFNQKEKEALVAGSMGYWETDVGSNIDPLRGNLLQNLKKSVPDAEMVAIKAFKNVNDGNTYVPAYSPVGAYSFVPKTAKDKDACIKYLNFLAGEGGKTIYFGIEGENYKLEDGVPTPIDLEKNTKELEWIKHDLFLVGNQGYFKSENDFTITNAKTVGEFEQYFIDDYNLSLDGTRLTHSTYTSPTQMKQAANLSKIYNDYMVKLITCKPGEFDAILVELKSELKKYDIEKILEEREAYYRNLK